MLRKRIIDDLKTSVNKFGFEVTDIVLSIPKNSSFGDYSTNLALQLAKVNPGSDKQSPQDIANKILENFGTPDYLEKAEIAGGGFINFFLKTEVLLKNLSQSYTHPAQDKKEKIMVEFTDPNPFKEFHIGHVFSNSVGEALCRLFEFQGDEVLRVNYFGDVGMHVAKSIWGLKQKLKEDGLSLEELEKGTLKEKVEYLGHAYVKGASSFEDPKFQEEIKRVNLVIYIAAQEFLKESTDFQPEADYASLVKTNSDEVKEIRHLFETGRKWSLDYFESIYVILGTKFNGYYPESIVGEYGLKQVKAHLEDGIFERSEGAIIFPGEKYGLHNRVFINSLGLPTYEAKELGLGVKKYEDYKYDRSIIVTGNEINEYFKVLMLALSKIQPEIAEKTIHLGHGMVRMIGSKMSSRKGNVLTFDDLYEAVKSKIDGLLKDFDPKEKEQVLKMVAVGAIKFAMLKHQPTVDTIFDIEKSVALQGDSGPYIQYTYARARSILRKLQPIDEIKLKVDSLEKEERQILQKIEYFPGMIEDALETLHPNVVALYLLELAGDFNLFYQKHRIIDAGEDKKMLRLALTQTVSAILKQGLYLLGIEAPEKM